jgi:hypothetical protein
LWIFFAVLHAVGVAAVTWWAIQDIARDEWSRQHGVIWQRTESRVTRQLQRQNEAAGVTAQQEAGAGDPDERATNEAIQVALMVEHDEQYQAELRALNERFDGAVRTDLLSRRNLTFFLVLWAGPLLAVFVIGWATRRSIAWVQSTRRQGRAPGRRH